MLTAIPCTVLRGGTSKGLYFDMGDIPADPELRDRVLLAAMGSPDIRQIDGMGGAHPLTSKVALLGRSARDDADVDYLFLQVVVDKAEVSDTQNCGNILAGVGPWAIENDFVAADGDVTPVRIHMVNTGSIAVAHVQTPGPTVLMQPIAIRTLQHQHIGSIGCLGRKQQGRVGSPKVPGKDHAGALRSLPYVARNIGRAQNMPGTLELHRQPRLRRHLIV